MKLESLDFQNYNWCMELALEQAELAYRQGEVPIGAVIVDEGGKLLAKAHNLKESVYDPTGHAEIKVIQQAAQQLNNWRLLNCTLIVTLEPCPMCLSAMVQARIKRVIFGAYDKKGGAISLGHNLHQDKRLNHQFESIGGINHYKCSKVLSSFFKQRRNSYRLNSKS
jgi:tRNA(adenine34) deaminase